MTRDVASWPELIYRFVEHYRWEPQHLGPTTADYYRKIRSQEVPLNLLFNLLLLVMPADSVRELLGPALALPMDGPELSVVSPRDEPFVQPDIHLESESERIFIEVKVNARLDLEQIQKYVLLHAKLDAQAAKASKHTFLLLLTRNRLHTHWAPRAEAPTDIGALAQRLRTQPLGAALSRKASVRPLVGAFSRVAASTRLGACTWQELADRLAAITCDLPARPHELAAGFLAELAQRDLAHAAAVTHARARSGVQTVRLDFVISRKAASDAREFFEHLRCNRLVELRQRRNVDRNRKPADESEFWDALVSALLTTQQRSGPRSAVGRFIQSVPFPLDLAACRANRPCRPHARRVIAAFGGIRRGPTIAAQLQANLEWLENGGWTEIVARMEALEASPSRGLERETARYLAGKLHGIGPKQSRNLLQLLGLTRYETPIDSRVTKWLNDRGFPFQISGMALSEAPVYELVLDGFQALCHRAGVLPCLMDAAIFASFDGSGWDEVGELRW